MWNVELVGGNYNGLCGAFKNSRINTCSEVHYEAELACVCDINVYDTARGHYKVHSASTINGVLAKLQDEPNCTYIYTEDFKYPDILIQESYEEEE